MSVSTSGAQGNYDSGASVHPVSISADGRFVAFQSSTSNLVAGDTNSSSDIFVRDRQTPVTTERVSVDSVGTQGNGSSDQPSISADGRFVAFFSAASNLVVGDTNLSGDIFVHELLTGLTERVSVGPAGVEGNSDSIRRPAVSADGRFVAFWSRASNLVAGDTNGCEDLFVRDRQNGTTERVSVVPSGAQASYLSYGGGPSISADGRFVAFQTDSWELVAGDTNGSRDIFVRDLQSGTTELASVASGGAQANNDSDDPSISGDGRFVVFVSNASNLVAGGSGAIAQIYLRDRQGPGGGTTERVSVDSSGVPGNWHSFSPSISADGRLVAFGSGASNLIAGDTNGLQDIFVRDPASATTERASIATGGSQSNGDSVSTSFSASGRFVAFDSAATNLVLGDTNGYTDIFVRDGGPGNPGIDLCQPGTGSMIACPCSNPPANAPRGCENSAGTGGAQLTSSGSASLALDTIVFVTNGEKPTATSIVLQGNAEVTNGIAFGQGVRCAGGGLKRLYVKAASGGSLTAPGPGDPSVSARSAALGSPISAGSNRWYAVYYRDPIVLGGCPATSTYNITQTQLVTWGF